MPDDPEFIAKVLFVQDPEFIKLERALQLRQEQERKDLLNKQEEQRIAFGREPGMTRQQLDDNYNRQIEEREAQSKKHHSEHNRYIREYHDAKVLRTEIEGQDRSKAPEHGPDIDDEPKFTK